MKKLPYTAVTASGEYIQFSFPLHPLTESPEQVGELLTRVLDAIDRSINDDDGASDGDVLQALCMALAVRTRMVEALPGVVHRLAWELAATALGGDSHVTRSTPH